MTTLKSSGPKKQKGIVTLKAVAQHLGLTPGTVSAVLNNSAAARSIPEHTRKRILTAARELKYRPNFLARSLRVQRTFSIGVITEEIGDEYGGMVVSGIEAYLSERNFFFLAVAHRHDPKLLETYSDMLIARGIEGLITIDTSIDAQPLLPTVAVAGHQKVENVTNIVLDHEHAAELALRHLKELGHTRIAFLRGQAKSSDSATRWAAIEEVARRFDIPIDPHLVLNSKEPTPLPSWVIPMARSYSRATFLSPRSSLTTTSPRLAQCAPSRKPAFESLSTFPSLALTTSVWHRFAFRPSPRCANLLRKWEELRRKPFSSASKTALPSYPKLPSSRNSSCAARLPRRVSCRSEGYAFARRSLFGFDPLNAKNRMYR